MTPFAKVFESPVYGQMLAMFDVAAEDPCVSVVFVIEDHGIMTTVMGFDDRDEAETMFNALDLVSMTAIVGPCIESVETEVVH